MGSSRARRSVELRANELAMVMSKITPLLAVLVLLSASCATPVRRRGQGVSDGTAPGAPRTSPDGRPVALEPGGADPTEPFRDALREASSPSARAQVVDEAVAAALAARRPVEAVTWLLEARSRERDPTLRAELERRTLELIETEVPPVGLRQLLEDGRRGEFPHELLLFKLGLVLKHGAETEAARAALEEYLSSYPSGVYAARARTAIEGLGTPSVSPQTIGVLLPLSGPKAAYGRLARQALELALEGSSVRAVVRDTKDDEATTAAAVQSLVEEEGAIALLGPVFRSESMAAAVMAQRLGVPILTISADEAVAHVGPWVFRNGVTNEMQAKAVVRHAMDVLGLSNFAILHPRHPYGVELRDHFWDEVLRRGGQIRAIEAYDVSATTFSGQVKSMVGRLEPERRPDYRAALLACDEQPDPYRVKRCKDEAKKNLRPIVDFDGLFIPDYARTIRMVAAALAAEDIIVEQDPRRLRVIEKTLGHSPKIVTLLGASGWNSDKITDSTGRTVENAVFVDGFFAESDDERTARFVQVYRDRYSRVPRLYPEALIFDSARILRSIVATQQPADRAAFAEAMRSVVRFPGVTGTTSFAGRTDAQKELKILRIEDGTIVQVPKPDALPPPARSGEGATLTPASAP